MIIDRLKESWTEMSDGKFIWQVPEGWMQGRSLFGGLSAAAAASLASLKTDRKLRTMQAQLVGPIVPGEISGECTIIRAGKTTSFIEVRLIQDKSLRALFVFVFVEKREGSVSISGPEKPDWLPPSEAIQIPYLDGLTPQFTQNVEFRFAYGGIAFQAFESPSTGGYVKFNNSKEILPPQQIALLDAWFPPIFPVLKKPVFGSTVTWTAHILADSLPGLHQFKYDSIVADGGFSTSVGHLWDSAGTYVGYTEQTVVIFD